MWTLLARCPDEELDQLIAAAGSGERIGRGEPIGAPGTPIEFGSEWWSPAVRVEYVDGVRVVEKNGFCLPLTGVTIVDRCNSMIWRNRLSGPRVGFVRVQFRDGALPALNKEAAVRKALQEGLKGQGLANRVCELCRVKKDAYGFGIRNIQLIVQKLRQE